MKVFVYDADGKKYPGQPKDGFADYGDAMIWGNSLRLDPMNIDTEG